MRTNCPRLLLLALCALLATAGTAHARGLKQFPSLGFGGAPPPPPAFSLPSSDCVDSFKAWLQEASTCTLPTSQCCTGLLDLGEACWNEVLDDVADDQELTDAIIDIYGQCGLTVTPINPSPPGPSPSPSPIGSLDEQQCIDDFNTALNITCASDSDFADCCNSLTDLGADCQAYLVDTMAASPEYTELLAAFTSTLGRCRIHLPDDGNNGPAPPMPSPPSPNPIPGPSPVGGCISSFYTALETSCSGTEIAPCCAALYNVGDSCLEQVADSITEEEAWEAFTTLLEGCGYSITTRARLVQGSVEPIDAEAEAAAAMAGVASLRSASLEQLQHHDCPLCSQQVQLELAPPSRVSRRSALVASPQFRSVKPSLLKKLAEGL